MTKLAVVLFSGAAEPVHEVDPPVVVESLACAPECRTNVST